MQVNISIKRHNPSAPDNNTYWEDFDLSMHDTASVLDALIKIREDVDGSLSVRCSCRSAICGSCAMRVNGHAKLACNTKLSDVIDADGRVTVEPAGVMPVIKDLVVDQTLFWDKVKQISPWLQPDGPEPEGEYIAPNSAMMDLAGVMNCIMCGACVSDCTVLEIDKDFIGPAALAKAYRFVNDPRDDQTKSRLIELNEITGIWDCTRCFECVEVCPKGVAPMERIMSLRESAMEQGLNKTVGARHADAFTDSVAHSGWLNELLLPLKTFGMFNLGAMMGLAPIGLRALLRGKMPSIFHRSVPNVHRIRRLVKKIEENE